jgi:UDP-2,3-diacylglucosamine pyrophosphatase LpxH
MASYYKVPEEIKTIINVPEETRIISFSDIHADIHSLIIVLRDCAQVIEKNDGHTFDQSIYDPELEILLNTNLTPKTEYPDNLNYKWKTGNKTIIVIVGDILDGRRGNTNITKDNSMAEHEYPQIEIKILRFINALNKQAVANGGRIYKLLGNHEIMNMDKYFFKAGDYIFKNDINNFKYYNNISRENIFKFGNYGHKLLFEDGCGSLLMINNYIFVHGQIMNQKLNKLSNTSIDLTFEYFDNLNKNINSYKSYDFDKALKELGRLLLSDYTNPNENSQLWGSAIRR